MCYNITELLKIVVYIKVNRPKQQTNMQMEMKLTMQNRKKKKPVTKNQHKKVRFEDLLEDDRFDDEDYDTVTGDTLEFLSLDDDTIASYNRSTRSRYAEEDDDEDYEEVDYEDEDDDEDYEEVDYEDEEDDDEDYEEVDYEDEEDDDEDYEEADYEDEDDDEDYEEVDYEDEEDDDENYEEVDYEDEEDEEDYEDYDDEDDGFAARLMSFVREMNGLDVAVAVLGILVLVGAVVTGGIYAHAKSTAKQVASFATVGEEIEGISVIGESGLLAVSESAKMGDMIDIEEEDPEQQEAKEEEDENGEVQVELRLTSIMSDIKIKFVNKKTGKLIGGVAFEVEVSGPRSYSLKDDDKDGVIYQTDVAAGSYDVKILPLPGENAEKYQLPSGSSSVKVTDKIAYEKVDVADEVKSESEINVAKEEATVQNTVVESALKDTVEWVESTKTPVGGADEEFEKVPLESIVDPWKATSAFRKMSNVDPTTDPSDPSVEKPDDPKPEDPKPDNPAPDNPDPDNPKPDNPDPDNPKPENPDPPKPSEKNVDLSLSSTGLNLEVGGSQTLSVKGSDGNSYSADWSSSNSDVASVSGGTVTAKAAGDATITATVRHMDGIKFNTDKLTCSVKVKAKETPKTEVTVALNKTSLALEAGKSETLSVSGGGSYTVEWSSDKSDVATVSGGTVTAKAAGTATITAKVTPGSNTVIKGSDTLKCTVTVTAKTTQAEVKLNKTELNLVKDQKETLKIVDGSGKTYSGTWATSDKSIAEVSSDGQVKAIKDGTATISVKVKAPDGVVIKNPDLSCKVTVGFKDYKKVTITGRNVVGLNQTITLTAKSDPEGAEIIWKSLDEKYAKVNDKGVVTGLKEGEVSIRAVCKTNEKIYADFKITVGKAVDGAAKLKDKDGNQIYFRREGEYIEATYADYPEHKNFFRKKKDAAYKYTGWQTIDGHLYYFDKDGNYVTGEQVIQGAKYTFGSDGKMAKSSGTMGIDVSKHNGNIDWEAVKNSGVSYVIIRCGYRGYSTGVLVEDPKAAGLKVGAYFFSQAVNEVEAVEEASMAIDLVKGYGLNYPLFLDVEGSGGRADGISRDTRTAVCRTFCQTVQNSGIQAGVYANKTWFTEKINTASLTSYKLWLAQYASAPTYTATRYDLWQYSSKGKVSGISGNVDMNISYVN